MSNINNGSTLKLNRINKELFMLKKSFDFNLIVNNDSLDVIINTKYNNNKSLIHIHLFNDYPFICPDVYLNGKPYRKLLEKISIKNNISSKCLCCKTILCPNNWKPGYKISNIIDEIFNCCLYHLYSLPVAVYD